MKLAGLLSVLVFFSSDSMAESRHAFEWMRTIEGESAAGEIVRIEIPPDVYARAYHFPRDLRILDADGRQWPFFIEQPPSQPAYQNVAATQINHTWIDDPNGYLRVDFHIHRTPTDQSRPVHNQVLLKSSGSDFIRRVEILGSEDQQTWALLGKGYLIEVNQPRHLVEDVIQYSESDYPHVQIRIYPNARNALETFSLNRAELRTRRERDIPTRDLPHQLLEVPRSEQKSDAQVLLLDLGFEKQPVEFLKLRAGGGDYVRRAVVYLRNDSSEPWRYAGAGDVHRVGLSIKDRVSISGTGRFLKCELYHYDDAPLRVDEIAVASSRTFLVVESQGGNLPVLYYGNPHADAPRYDLASRSDRMNSTAWETRELGDPVANPHVRRSGYGAWGPRLAAAAVGLASLVIILVVVRMFKRGIPA